MRRWLTPLALCAGSLVSGLLLLVVGDGPGRVFAAATLLLGLFAVGAAVVTVWPPYPDGDDDCDVPVM